MATIPASFPRSIPPGPRTATPASIIAPRAGRLRVQHYYGNGTEPWDNRLWIVAPVNGGEVTDGIQVRSFPGDYRDISVQAGDEIIVRLGGELGVEGGDAAYVPNSEQAIVEDVTAEFGDWAFYIEWEDLDLTPYVAANADFNDSRTLIFYPDVTVTRRPVLGRVGFG